MYLLFNNAISTSDECHNFLRMHTELDLGMYKINFVFMKL